MVDLMLGSFIFSYVVDLLTKNTYSEISDLGEVFTYAQLTGLDWE